MRVQTLWSLRGLTLSVVRPFFVRVGWMRAVQTRARWSRSFRPISVPSSPWSCLTNARSRILSSQRSMLGHVRRLMFHPLQQTTVPRTSPNRRSRAPTSSRSRRRWTRDTPSMFAPVPSSPHGRLNDRGADESGAAQLASTYRSIYRIEGIRLGSW